MARKNGKDRGITQRKGREGWWVRFFVNGREKWYRCENKSQAKALYGRLKAEIREGTYFPKKYQQPKPITLRAWIERCLAGSTNRGRQHERQRASYWAEALGSRSLTDLTTEDLRQHQAKMVASGEWTPATVNRYFSALRRILTLAVQDGKLPRHVMGGIKFFPEAQTDRFFTDQELKRLRQLMDPEEWTLVAFAIETCLRLSEQFALRWNQISFDAKTLTIPLPKGNRTRRVPLSKNALTILRSQGSLLESPWVFPDALNPLEHRNPYRVAEQFKRVLRRAGIVDASWHTLRHTGASRRLMAGVDIVTVSKILGHTTIQTTMRYAHLVKSHVEDAINRGSLEESGKERIPELEPGPKP